MLKFVADVLPEAIFDDAAPLTGTESFDAELQQAFTEFVALKNRNVFVELENGDYYVGLLHGINGSHFYVGDKSPELCYVNVKGYRLV